MSGKQLYFSGQPQNHYDGYTTHLKEGYIAIEVAEVGGIIDKQKTVRLHMYLQGTYLIVK